MKHLRHLLEALLDQRSNGQSLIDLAGHQSDGPDLGFDQFVQEPNHVIGRVRSVETEEIHIHRDHDISGVYHRAGLKEVNGRRNVDDYRVIVASRTAPT